MVNDPKIYHLSKLTLTLGMKRTLNCFKINFIILNIFGYTCLYASSIPSPLGKVYVTLKGCKYVLHIISMDFSSDENSLLAAYISFECNIRIWIVYNALQTRMYRKRLIALVMLLQNCTRSYVINET